MFVPGKTFQPILMFVSKAGAYLSEAPFRGLPLGLGPGLLRTFVNYGHKNLIFGRGLILIHKH